MAAVGGAKGILKARLSRRSSPWPRAGDARRKGRPANAPIHTNQHRPASQEGVPLPVHAKVPLGLWGPGFWKAISPQLRRFKY